MRREEGVNMWKMELLDVCTDLYLLFEECVECGADAKLIEHIE
jgi:hypothetical protein